MGMGVKVDAGATVAVGTILAAGVQEARMVATSETVTMFLILIDSLFCKELPTAARA